MKCAREGCRNEVPPRRVRAGIAKRFCTPKCQVKAKSDGRRTVVRTDKQRTANRDSYYRHRTKRLAAVASYRTAHKEEIKRYYRVWALSNYSAIQTYSREYYKEHKTEVIAKTRSNRSFLLTLRLAFWIADFKQQMEEKEMTKKEVEFARAELKNVDTADLKSQFAAGMLMSRTLLIKQAAILAELEFRGEKVDGEKPYLRMLRSIACGNWNVDVVTRFAGRPYTMAAILALPPEVQDQLLQKTDEEVEQFVIKRREERQTTRKKLRVANNEQPDDLNSVGLTEDGMVKVVLSGNEHLLTQDAALRLEIDLARVLRRRAAN